MKIGKRQVSVKYSLNSTMQECDWMRRWGQKSVHQRCLEGYHRHDGQCCEVMLEEQGPIFLSNFTQQFTCMYV